MSVATYKALQPSGTTALITLKSSDECGVEQQLLKDTVENMQILFTDLNVNRVTTPDFGNKNIDWPTRFVFNINFSHLVCTKSESVSRHISKRW